MSDLTKENKDLGSIEAVFKDTSSPRTNKKEKTKYQAFRSDDSLSSDNEENEQISTRSRRKAKQRNTSFKVKIKNIKEKKKDKDKDKDKDKKKEKEKSKRKLKKGNSEEAVIDTTEYPLHGPVFGVPLEVAVERSSFPDKIELPRIVRECILFVEEKGLTTEGIYRLSGVKSKVDNLKLLYNEGRPVSLDDCDANTVASLLKLYLRELPSSILTTRLAPIFDSFINLENEDEQIFQFQKLLNDLPCPNRTLLQWMFTHFGHIIEQFQETKMNVQNLSIVFSPTMKVSHGVLNIFFQHSKIFFPDIELIKYVPVQEEEDEDGFPTTIEGLQELLKENEAVLTELHDRVNQGDSSQDEELWERQRKATQIKRKIKLLQKAERERLKKEALEQEQQQEKQDDKSDHKPTIKELAAASAQKTDEHSTVSLAEPDVPTQQIQQQNKVIEAKPPRKKAPKPPRTTVNDDLKDKEKNVEEKKIIKTSTSIENLDDDEFRQMLLEEKKLTIENEELVALSDLLKKKIQIEKREISTLKDKLQECIDHKDNDMDSSSISSFSSSSSIASSDEEEKPDSTASDEEDLLQLELILTELEKENEKLEEESKDLLEKINEGRVTCMKLRTDIRMKESPLKAT